MLIGTPTNGERVNHACLSVYKAVSWVISRWYNSLTLKIFLTLSLIFIPEKSNRGISECLPRLTSVIRGIGDPLVAVYARAYLCRVGYQIALLCRKLNTASSATNEVGEELTAVFI